MLCLANVGYDVSMKFWCFFKGYCCCWTVIESHMFDLLLVDDNLITMNKDERLL